MEIDKTPLQPGRSYPLRSSVLCSLVEGAGLITVMVLHQRSMAWWTDGVLFRADFYPPNGTVADKGDILHLTCRSVSSNETQAARRHLEDVVLPDFVAWLADFERLPEITTARREKRSFTRSWSPLEPVVGEN